MDDIEAHVAALFEGRGAVDLSSWRKLDVRGSDASSWLQDLLSADVASLSPGTARRSLLLGPTGRVRADVQVAKTREGFLLLQDDEQPEHIERLLSPYVLSSHVRARDVGSELALFAVLGGVPGDVTLETFAPSALGPGLDVVTAAGEDARRAEQTLARAGIALIDPRAVEIWRIRRGVARMGPDFDASSLPSEAGLDGAIDRTKGCFLGQESIARVDNLGHPPRLLVHVAIPGTVRPGDAVLDAGSEVGSITSAAPASGVGGSSIALARVRWDAASHPLVTRDGRSVTPVLASG